MINFEAVLRTLEEAKVEYIVVGGFAARLHGAARMTDDLDILYSRTRENLKRLTSALEPLHPVLRGAPPGLPFHFDVPTLRAGLNFTLTTDAGDLDCLGDISGVGTYDAAMPRTVVTELFGMSVRILDLDALIAAKTAAGRRKDFEALAELNAIKEERKPQ